MIFFVFWTKFDEDGLIDAIIYSGVVVKPDKTSATFLSFIGNFDKRVELDNTIKYDDPKYHAALSMMASKASYENKAYIETTVRDHWKVYMLNKLISSSPILKST